LAILSVFIGPSNTGDCDQDHPVSTIELGIKRLRSGGGVQMPEARLKRKIPESENPIATNEDQQISADAVMSTFEQICLAMSASGAVVAMRDIRGIRCVVSFGNAPSVGTRLQPDSAFTTECIETGEVVLCEDTQNDPRIQPDIAESLNLRSAVAVPIRAQGSVIGLIEVFCSQPSCIYPTAVTALKRVAKSFAATMIESSSGESIAGGSVVNLRQAVGPPCAAEPSAEQQPLGKDTTEERFIVSPQAATEQGSASVATPSAEAIEQLEPPMPSETENSAFRWLRGDSKSARFGLVGATVVLLLALLFLFIGSRHQRGVQISRNNAVSSASDRARDGEARKGSTKVQPQEKVRAPSSNGSEPAAPPGVPLAKDSTAASKPDRVQGKVGAAGISIPGAIPADNETIGSNVLPQEGDVRRERSRELKSPSLVGRQPDPTPFSDSLLEAPELGPALPTNAAKPDITGGASVLASPINPRTPLPNFVLDRTFKGHSDWVTAVAFTSPGVLASGSWDASVRFWDVATGRELDGLRGHVKHVQALSCSRDGHWLAAENSADTVTVWDATTGKEIRTLASDKAVPAVGTSWVYSIAFSPDGRWLASGVDDKTVRIWEMSTGRMLRDLTALRRSVIYMAFSPDGRLVASGNDDKTIQIWDVSTGAEIRVLSGHRKPVYAVAFSPNGRWLVSASGDKTVKIWDVATGHEVRTLPGHQNAVTSLAFSPDGRWLATGSWDKTIKLWDMATGNELQTLSAKTNSIYAVAFDSTGHWLASGSEDGTVNLWRLSDAVNHPALRTNP
jgi:WD40 repeat protein